MKRSVSLIVVSSLCAIAALSQQSVSPSPDAVVHVATALNHLTVLEFHEPVTMAAAGSSDFQIERESNKVFVKPVKSGQRRICSCGRLPDGLLTSLKSPKK
jgi:hypothetical protein